ncbi:hypothetical protein [Georgenia sunbinii]|uniref:hypothetical protein n=1 Tax=Georgenia sunbinii TaxID=3117728 RepID=UPI002F264D36
MAWPLLTLIVGGVALALALLLMWGVSQRESADPVPLPDAALAVTEPALGNNDEDEDDDEIPTPEAGPDEPAGTAEEVDAVELAQAVARLDSLVQTSSCANLYADAQIFHEYVPVAGSTGSWADLVSARRPAVTLDGLAARCDGRYVEQLARYIIDDPRADPLLVYTLQDHLAELPQHHPAPTDALDAPTFRTAGGVGCTLTYDGVGCAVTTHDFADPPACLEGATGAFSVALFATEIYPCAGTVTGGATELADGRSAAVGDYACTAVGTGVRCWHTVSGTEFALSPTEVTLP